MPGALPATSGYTYAVELTADEAIQAGANSVTFDPPLALYVENFLDFPVGGIVPTGYYDRATSAWIASANGRVVRGPAFWQTAEIEEAPLLVAATRALIAEALPA